MYIDGFQMNRDHSGYRSEHPCGQLKWNPALSLPRWEMQQIECTANGTEKSETIVSSYVESVTAQQPWPQHKLCQACVWKEATGGWREIRS